MICCLICFSFFWIHENSGFGGKEQSNPTSTGLMIVWVKNVYLVQNKSQTLSLWITEVVLENHICLGVQSHPEDQGDFEQGVQHYIFQNVTITVEYICCIYMVLTKPHKKHEFNYHYEDIYDNSENLSKVNPVYGNSNVMDPRKSYLLFAPGVVSDILPYIVSTHTQDQGVLGRF